LPRHRLSEFSIVWYSVEGKIESGNKIEGFYSIGITAFAQQPRWRLWNPHQANDVGDCAPHRRNKIEVKPVLRNKSEVSTTNQKRRAIIGI